MTCIINTKPKRHLSAKLAAGVAITALLVLGTFVAPASARDHRGDHRGGYGHGDYRRGGWGGGWGAPPPVVYGSPYYAPPPVVYGGGVGVYLQGINIGIH